MREKTSAPLGRGAPGSHYSAADDQQAAVLEPLTRSVSLGGGVGGKMPRAIIQQVSEPSAFVRRKRSEDS